jgi:type II secretory pathway pseudopilin PulG
MSQAGQYRSAIGMTLIEAVLSMLILSIVASIVLPILSSATEAYASAVDVRERVSRVSHAMDRIVRMLRETPLAIDGTNQLGLTSVSIDHIEMIDGRGIYLQDHQLMMSDAHGLNGLLCDEVTLFEIHLLGPDGVTSAQNSPTQAHVMHVYIEVGGIALRSVVFPRVRMTERASG